MVAPARKKYKGKTRRLLLGLDIGTTFSGISYSILDPGKVPETRTVTRYPSQEQAGGDSKIPTAIYYDARGRPCALGAETTKEGIEVDAEENGWTKAQWFKLHLRPTQANAPAAGHKKDEVPPLPPNKTVVDVFADFMKYLLDCAKAYISQTHGEKVWTSLENDIMYVLTHPNGWGGPQQGQMRQAAVKAGWIPDTEHGAARVSFVTEGEASLHFCLSNGLGENSADNGILIVDAGGGTIDLTAYKRCPDKSFTEICIPKCYFQGSAYVTIRAESYFKKLLAKSKFEPDVETLKNRFDRNTKPVFKRADESHHIQFAPMRERDAKLNIRNGRLTLSGSTIASFFEPSVSSIIIAVKKHCHNAHHPIKTVLLVGGFSASDWLFEKVREGLQCLEDVTISRPDSHINKAVSDGAISFYLDGAVSSRMARATYGITGCTHYNPSKPEHRKRSHLITATWADGLPRLPNAYFPIIARGTMVDATQEFSKPFVTQDAHAANLKKYSVVIVAYNGPAKDTNHWTDEEPGSYHSLCHVTADTSKVKLVHVDSVAGSYYILDFKVVLLFGLTELKAQIAWTGEDGEEQRGPAAVVYDHDNI